MCRSNCTILFAAENCACMLNFVQDSYHTHTHCRYTHTIAFSRNVNGNLIIYAETHSTWGIINHSRLASIRFLAVIHFGVVVLFFSSFCSAAIIVVVVDVVTATAALC